MGMKRFQCRGRGEKEPAGTESSSGLRHKGDRPQLGGATLRIYLFIYITNGIYENGATMIWEPSFLQFPLIYPIIFVLALVLIASSAVLTSSFLFVCIYPYFGLARLVGSLV